MSFSGDAIIPTYLPTLYPGAWTVHVRNSQQIELSSSLPNRRSSDHSDLPSSLVVLQHIKPNHEPSFVSSFITNACVVFATTTTGDASADDDSSWVPNVPRPQTTSLPFALRFSPRPSCCFSTSWRLVIGVVAGVRISDPAELRLIRILAFFPLIVHFHFSSWAASPALSIRPRG